MNELEMRARDVIEARFKSGNSIPVERVHITRAEFDALSQQPSAVVDDEMRLVTALEAFGKASAAWTKRPDDRDEPRNRFAMRAALAAAPQQAAGVPDGVDWKSMYRIQTAMRYMDKIDGLTRDKAYSMADEDVAGLKALAARKPEVGS